MKNIFKLPLLFLISACMGLGASAATETTNSFEIGKGAFMLNGEPFVIKAAELHYPRIPKPYWDQRIKMCKALGMNVSLCVLECTRTPT